MLLVLYLLLSTAAHIQCEEDRVTFLGFSWNSTLDAAIRSAAVRINDTWILIGSAAVRIVARGFLLAQRLCE